MIMRRQKWFICISWCLF